MPDPFQNHEDDLSTIAEERSTELKTSTASANRTFEKKKNGTFEKQPQMAGQAPHVEGVDTVANVSAETYAVKSPVTSFTRTSSRWGHYLC